MHQLGLEVPKNTQNSLLPGRVFNLPGRGVLRFWAQAYRNPVHFSAIFALGVDVIQPRLRRQKRVLLPSLHLRANGLACVLLLFVDCCNIYTFIQTMDRIS